MILVDANLLVYAKVTNFAQHDRAREWLDRRLGGRTRVGLAWESLTAFVRLVTNPRVFTDPMAPSAAMTQVQEWLSRPAAWIPQPTADHARRLAELLEEGGSGAELVPDAHLAAIAQGHGLTVMSVDRDFARFESVRWEDPLES